MFLPINTQKQYLELGDCIDGLKGQKLHEISQQIQTQRVNILKELSLSIMRKKILGEEMSQNVEEYLEGKNLICKKFSKQVFNLVDSNQINSSIKNDELIVDTPETQEIRTDILQLRTILRNALEQ